MKKLLYILNIAKRVNNFSYTSMLAAKEIGIEFHIAGNWSYASDEERIADEEKYGIKIHQIDFMRAPYHPGNIKAYKQLKRLAAAEKYDFIHCNTPIGGVLGRLIGKKFNIGRVIYQAHGFHFYKGASMKNWLLYYPVEKWLAHYTDALITINSEDFELAKTKLKLRKNGKVYYVPGVGIDTSQYNPTGKSREEKRTESGIPLDAFVLISVGELNTNKNNGVIISAMEKLNSKNIHYILCGIGENREELQEQADKAGLHDNVHFLGFRNDVNKLYEAADCFVMPSFREGLSRSVMEAMASGLPCVVSKIRGNTDLITDNKGGFLCEPSDSEGFAQAIGLLCDNKPLCDEMSRFNKTKIKDFDTSVSEKAMRSIYTEVF